MNPVIDIQSLTYVRGGAKILDNISLRLEAGEFLGIIGPNGGGKTTLLRILTGLERDYEGDVKLYGHDPSSSHQWRARVGVVPQRTDFPLRFPILAHEVVEMGTRARGAKLSKQQRTTRVQDALRLVGADSYAHRPLRELSGGQRQRVFIARALAAEPELLFLDEPTVGVDAFGQDLLLRWMAEWRRTKNLSVVLITHDVGMITPLVDKIACLNVRLHFHDRPDQLTGADIENTYGCPAEMIFHSAHTVPHRVLGKHSHE